VENVQESQQQGSLNLVGLVNFKNHN